MSEKTELGHVFNWSYAQPTWAWCHWRPWNKNTRNMMIGARHAIHSVFLDENTAYACLGFTIEVLEPFWLKAIY